MTLAIKVPFPNVPFPPSNSVVPQLVNTLAE
jgi:hypothetical protein